MNPAQLAQWLQGTDLRVLELHGPGMRLRLVRDGDAVVEAEIAPPVAATAFHPVRAGSVGHCLLTQPGRDQPFVRPGQSVRAGEPLALLRIGLVLLPVLAPQAGTVARIVVQEGEAVGYGHTLVELA